MSGGLEGIRCEFSPRWSHMAHLGLLASNHGMYKILLHKNACKRFGAIRLHCGLFTYTYLKTYQIPDSTNEIKNSAQITL